MVDDLLAAYAELSVLTRLPRCPAGTFATWLHVLSAGCPRGLEVAAEVAGGRRTRAIRAAPTAAGTA